MNNYRDDFFERGHWLLKLRQVLVVLLCWLLMLLPIIVTGATYLAYRTHGKHGHYFWHYSEGFAEINFLLVFLAFAVFMVATFCFAMAFIQTVRAKGLVEKWPLFDFDEEETEAKRAEKFMAKRFGPKEMRQNARYYTVKPNQNLPKDKLGDVIRGEELD